MLYCTDMSLSTAREYPEAGRIYLMNAVPQNKRTTMRWAAHVEKALCLPSDELILMIVEIILMYEARMRRREANPNVILNVRIIISLPKVSVHESCSRRGSSQLKWFTSLESQKLSSVRKIVLTRESKKPDIQAPNTICMQTRWFIVVLYLRGLHIATYRSYAIAERRKISVPTMKIKKNICAMHPLNEIVFCSARNPSSIFGTVTEE